MDATTYYATFAYSFRQGDLTQKDRKNIIFARATHHHLAFFLIGRGGYLRGHGQVPEPMMLNFIVLDLRGLLSFSIFWAMAMIYRKKPDTHMRYMIATGILAIGPGLARGLTNNFGLEIWDAMSIADLLNLVILGVLLGFDLHRKKNYKPFLSIFIVILIGALFWQLRDSAVWQNIAKNYAQLFY